MSDMVAASEQYKFAFVALKAVGDQMMNVVLRGQADPKKPDDILYTRAVVEEVQSAICVDSRRIFCAGYSAGARFCSMVASEMSGRIAAIAAVSGIRFPEPLAAHQRPMPIIAFHGKRDPVNPYVGHGNPMYWDDSVPRAVKKWTDFNKCRQVSTTHPLKDITVNEHFACAKNASVVLVTIDDGGHTWPGSSYDFSKVVGLPLGKTTHKINANAMIAAFFAQHPLPTVLAADPRERADDEKVNPAEAEAATLLQKAQLENHGPDTSKITSSQLVGGILAVVAALSGISAGAIAMARLARRPSCHHSESATMLSSDFARSTDAVSEPCASFLLDAVE
jgi:poly(3-hydroxybutyrate) depolymerase